MNLADFHIVRVDRVHDVTLAPLLKQYCSEMRAWMAPTSGAAEGFTYPLERVWNDDTDVYLAHVADMAPGVPPKRAQETLGHADVRTTLAIYTHAMRPSTTTRPDKMAELAGLTNLGNNRETIGSIESQEEELSDCLDGSPGCGAISRAVPEQRGILATCLAPLPLE
jgi:hypothetical protein